VPDRRRLPLVASLAIVALGLVALIAYALVGDVVPAPGGVYVEGLVGTPRYLNPLLAAPGSPDDDVCALVFEGLTRLGPDGAAAPGLASEWTVESGGRAYSFRLRRDVRWHDGSPLRAEDVVATVRALQAPDFPGDAGLAAEWRGIAVEVTADGVRFTLPEPDAWFPEQAALGLIPAAAAGALRGQPGLAADFNLRPIGTGPFRVTAAELRRIELTAWDGYPDRQPLVRGVELRFFGTAEAALAALRRGELTAVRPTQLGDAAADAARQGGAAAHQRAERGKTVELLFNTRAAPLDDPATRAALALAIDRDRVAATQPAAVALDAARPAGGLSAREAIERAGWRDVDKEGARLRDGRPLRFTLVTNDRPERVAAAEEVARQLGALGARVEVQQVGWSGLIADLLQPGRFQAALVELHDPTPIPDPGARWGGGAELNLGSWAPPRAAELLARARGSTTPAGRAAALRDWQALVEAEAPTVPLFSPRLTYLVAPQLRGQRLPPLVAPRDRFADVLDWFLLTRRAPGKF
jgi:peptide/nickel transport system substrate-binding protein